GDEITFSEQFSCPVCGFSFAELEPRNFSFNSPHGACDTCMGLGTTMEFEPDLVIPNRALSIAQGAIAPWVRSGLENSKWYGALLKGVAKAYDFSLDVPVMEMDPAHVDLLLNGTGDEKIQVEYSPRSGRRRKYNVAFEGVIPNLQRRHRQTESEFMREQIEHFMATRPCPTCHGQRLRPEILSVTVADKS